jgi:hypothetical protein
VCRSLSFWMCSDLSLCSFDILVLTTFRSIWITFDTFTCIRYYYSIKFPLVAELFIFLLVFALFFHIHMYIFPIMHLESSSSDFNTSSSSFIADLTRHTDLLHLITYIFLLEVYKNFFWNNPNVGNGWKWLLIVMVYVDFTVLTNRVVVI